MKSNLRKKYKEIRKSILPDEKISLDDRIYENIISSPYYEENHVILVYVSLFDEVNTDKLIKKAFSDKKLVFAPKCRDKLGNMDFYRIDSFDDLNNGFYGIREPKENLSELYDKKLGGICLVPGLSFSRDGYRLGYGKGYYDRFISGNKDIFYIGICYERQLSENLLHDEYDRKVNAVITENSLWRCGNV